MTSKNRKSRREDLAGLNLSVPADRVAWWHDRDRVVWLDGRKVPDLDESLIRDWCPVDGVRRCPTSFRHYRPERAIYLPQSLETGLAYLARRPVAFVQATGQFRDLGYGGEGVWVCQQAFKWWPRADTDQNAYAYGYLDLETRSFCTRRAPLGPVGPGGAILWAKTYVEPSKLWSGAQDLMRQIKDQDPHWVYLDRAWLEKLEPIPSMIEMWQHGFFVRPDDVRTSCEKDKP